MNISKLLKNSKNHFETNPLLYYYNEEKLNNIVFPDNNLFFTDDSDRILHENKVYKIINKKFTFDRYDLLEIYLHNLISEGKTILIRRIFENILHNKYIQMDYVIIDKAEGDKKILAELKEKVIEAKKNYENFLNNKYSDFTKNELSEECLRLQNECNNTYIKYIEQIQKMKSKNQSKNTNEN